MNHPVQRGVELIRFHGLGKVGVHARLEGVLHILVEGVGGHGDDGIKKLPWGWVKESQENVKVFKSVPKAFGLETILEYMDEDHMAAKEAIVDHALDEMMFG